MSRNDLQFLNPLIEKLRSCLEVRAVLCYGSTATGLSDDRSDIDLLVIVKGELPEAEIRRKAYQGYTIEALDFTATLASEWDNSWSPINDRLRLDSQVVEIGYNRVTWVETVFHKLLDEGLITFAEFPFRPYTFLGLLDNSIILFEQEGYLTSLRKRVHPVPAKLKAAIRDTNLATLEESYNDLKDCIERDVGILSTAFFLFRAIDAATTLLFLLNDAYDPASKRTEPLLFRLGKLPPNFRALLEEELPSFYSNREKILVRLDEIMSFIHTNYV